MPLTKEYIDHNSRPGHFIPFVDLTLPKPHNSRLP